jgi:hypothetical protein
LLASGWCQGADARDSEGSTVDPWHERAVEWSVLGAIVATLEREAHARGEVPLEELASALFALAELIESDSLEAWNDSAERTHGEVLAVLEGAQARFEPPWPPEERPEVRLN